MGVCHIYIYIYISQKKGAQVVIYNKNYTCSKNGRHMRQSVTSPKDARAARQSLPLKTFYKTFGKRVS